MAVLAGAGDLMFATAVAALVLFVLEIRYIPILRRLSARHWVDRSRNDDDLDPPRPDQKQ